MTSIKETGVLVIIFTAVTIFFAGPLTAVSAESAAASASASAESAAVSAFAAERVRVSVSARAGILYGHSEELVYKSPERDMYSSELLWDLRPLVYTGVQADFGPRDMFAHNALAAAFSFRFGLPLKTGIVEDRDWLNNNNNFMTHYSRHDAYSRHAILSDISLGYSWTFGGFFALKAFGEFSFMNFSWSARDGYIQYPSADSSGGYPQWNGSLEKTFIEGTAIRYSQNWFILAPGLSLAGKLGRLFYIEGVFNYSPLVFCAARDEHPMRGVVFRDQLDYGHYVQGRGTLVFQAAGNLDISLNVSYRYITGPRGDSRVQNMVYNEGAGAEYSALDVGLAVTYALPAGTGR